YSHPGFITGAIVHVFFHFYFNSLGWKDGIATGIKNYRSTILKSNINPEGSSLIKSPRIDNIKDKTIKNFNFSTKKA
ncbi:hypothetical protein, partial [Buttiauxella noackiae]|uniref:hypothetical protein n=1 Tax=Buttiauxella noackiae TaxID=82992 RepID=UPI001ADF3358